MGPSTTCSLLRIVLAGMVLAISVGCDRRDLRTPLPIVHGNQALISRLSGRGPVPLSSQNPFLASNLLIAREAERSEDLAGFIKYRGAPPAIEVAQESFGNLTMQFYYPDKRESYTLEAVMGVWVIRGPLPIETEKLRDVTFVTRDIEGEPMLLPPRVSSESSEPPAPTVPTSAPSEPRIDPPRHEPSPRDHTIAQPRGFQSTARPTNTIADQRAVIERILGSTPKHFAEESPEGDIVHYVTFEGESLSIISRWYTFDQTNAERIGRINQLRQPNRLLVGDTIVIPKYLVRNKVRLTESALQQIQATLR